MHDVVEHLRACGVAWLTEEDGKRLADEIERLRALLVDMRAFVSDARGYSSNLAFQHRIDALLERSNKAAGRLGE